MATNNNTEKLSHEEKAFRDAKKFLYLISETVVIEQKFMEDNIPSLFSLMRSNFKKYKKDFVDVIKELQTGNKNDEDFFKDIKEVGLFEQKLNSLDLMFLEIKKEFVTKIDEALKLDFRQRQKSFRKIESDCNKVKDFLTKYFGQIKTAAGILKSIFEKIDNNTLDFELERSNWNKIVCGIKKNIEVLSTEMLSKVKNVDVMGL